jgi:membrane protease YdiL (CAAX protease family)
MLLPLALLGVAVQTGAEELVFRGYLQQQLAARFRSPLIWMLVPSLAFGAAHYDPATSGGNLWLIVLATGAFGLAAADLTARSGSLGAAWGFHFANNVAALLVIAVKGTIPGLALFTTPYDATDPVMRGLVVIDIVTLAVAWLLVRRALSR